MSTEREPCPWRIIEDSGGAFAFGMVGGTVWHFVGGARNAPAVWGMLFSSFECIISHARKKEDLWNGIMSGAATGGVLAARAGLKAAGKNALMGGVLLAAIEGLGVLAQRMVAPMMEETQQAVGQAVDKLEPPSDPLRPYRAPIRKAMSKAFTQGGAVGMPLGFEGADTGGLSERAAPDEFDFATGRYKSELQSTASEEAANRKEDAEIAVEDKKKGWW